MKKFLIGDSQLRNKLSLIYIFNNIMSSEFRFKIPFFGFDSLFLNKKVFVKRVSKNIKRELKLINNSRCAL